MEVFVLVSGYIDQHERGWADPLQEHCEEVEIIGVYSTLEKAVAYISETGQTLPPMKEVELHGDAFALGKCTNIGHYYIVKKILQ